MILPVQRVEPIRFPKKKEEAPTYKEESKGNQSSQQKKHQNRKKKIPFLPSYPNVSLDSEVADGKPDHEKAMEQYLYEEGRKSSFEAKV